MTLEQRIAGDKKKFLEYYAQLPIQKLAAGWIGKDEETITRWKREDMDFVEKIRQARSVWALKKIGGVRSKEWLLERTLKDEFAVRQEFTGKDGDRIQVTLSSYGLHDPLQLYTESPDADGVVRPAPISGAQLAQEGTKDKSSDQPVGAVGERG